MNTLYYNGDIENAHLAEILHEIYVQGVYHRFLLDRTGLTIVDLGANIGLTSMLFAKHWADKVIAVEPSESHFKCLVLNTDGIPGIVPMNAAVAAKTKCATLHHYPNVTAYSLAEVPAGDLAMTGTETVQCYGIFDLLTEAGVDIVDFMKMDVEGAEYEIIDSEQFAMCCPRIREIVGELHSWSTPGYAPAVDVIDTFTKRMNELGYQMQWHLPEPNCLQTMFHAVRND